jgi:hypothetical protein
MADRKVQSIRLRLEYSVKADDEQGIRFDPYEVAKEFSLVAKVYVGSPDNELGDAVLGLKSGDDAPYELFRRQDVIKFDFDHQDELNPLQGAIKISFTGVDTETGQPISSTAYFPINDNPFDEEEWPIGEEWKWLLKQEIVAADPLIAVYRLVWSKPAGPGTHPDEICRALNCRTTWSPSHLIKCFRYECYRRDY